MQNLWENGQTFLDWFFKSLLEGYTYDIDYEYLSKNSQIQNYIFLKSGDVIHLPDNSLSQVHVLGEASNPVSINLTRKNIPLSVALAQAKGLNQSTAKGKEVYILRPKDYEGKPRIFKSDMSSPTGYLVASEFNLQSQDIVFISTAGVTSWSRFINQVLPFTIYQFRWKTETLKTGESILCKS